MSYATINVEDLRITGCNVKSPLLQTSSMDIPEDEDGDQPGPPSPVTSPLGTNFKSLQRNRRPSIPLKQDGSGGGGSQYTWTVRRNPSFAEVVAASPAAFEEEEEGRRSSWEGPSAEDIMIEMPHEMMQEVVADAVQGAVQAAMEESQGVRFDVRANVFTLVAITGVVLYWRGVWSLWDTAVGVSVASAVASLSTGLTIMLIFRFCHLPLVESLPGG